MAGGLWSSRWAGSEGGEMGVAGEKGCKRCSGASVGGVSGINIPSPRQDLAEFENFNSVFIYREPSFPARFAKLAFGSGCFPSIHVESNGASGAP